MKIKMKNLVFLLLALSLVLTGCSKTENESAQADGKSTVGEVIRVGTMPNHIGLPLQYALHVLSIHLTIILTVVK